MCEVLSISQTKLATEQDECWVSMGMCLAREIPRYTLAVMLFLIEEI